jgi:histone H3/H4
MGRKPKMVKDENNVNVNDVKDVKDENKDNKESLFSKHALVNLSRKAGVKSISQDGVSKINEVLTRKMDELSERLSIFCNSKNGRTITKKLVFQFLQSEDIHYTDCTHKD